MVLQVLHFLEVYKLHLCNCKLGNESGFEFEIQTSFGHCHGRKARLLESKTLEITFQDESLYLIVDGMDQNTTMVSKMQQAVKSIEGRYVKTHLCGVSVHGVALYTHVWFYAHHKHDSNQVVKSITKVLRDVCSRRGTLPCSLQIKVDKCGHGNKNKYMLILRNISGTSIFCRGAFRVPNSGTHT